MTARIYQKRLHTQTDARLQRDCLSIEDRQDGTCTHVSDVGNNVPPVGHRQTQYQTDFCSCDPDPMTLTCELDLDIGRVSE